MPRGTISPARSAGTSARSLGSRRARLERLEVESRCSSSGRGAGGAERGPAGDAGDARRRTAAGRHRPARLVRRRRRRLGRPGDAPGAAGRADRRRADPRRAAVRPPDGRAHERDDPAGPGGPSRRRAPARSTCSTSAARSPSTSTPSCTVRPTCRTGAGDDAEEAIHDELVGLIEAAQGRTLALFTSLGAMNRAADALPGAPRLPAPRPGRSRQGGAARPVRDGTRGVPLRDDGLLAGSRRPGVDALARRHRPDPVPPARRSADRRPPRTRRARRLRDDRPPAGGDPARPGRRPADPHAPRTAAWSPCSTRGSRPPATAGSSSGRCRRCGGRRTAGSPRSSSAPWSGRAHSVAEALDRLDAALPVALDAHVEVEVGAGRELLAHRRADRLQHLAALADDDRAGSGARRGSRSGCRATPTRRPGRRSSAGARRGRSSAAARARARRRRRPRGRRSRRPRGSSGGPRAAGRRGGREGGDAAPGPAETGKYSPRLRARARPRPSRAGASVAGRGAASTLFTTTTESGRPDAPR